MQFGLARALGEEVKEKAEWSPIETSCNPNDRRSAKGTLECVINLNERGIRSSSPYCDGKERKAREKNHRL